MAKKKTDTYNLGYTPTKGVELPMYRHDMKREKDVTIDLYMKDGTPCGDIGDDTYEAADIGKGNVVGGTKMGIHHGFETGIPNAGRQDITAETLLPEHEENIAESALKTIEDPTWGGKISPENMAIHNTFGIK